MNSKKRTPTASDNSSGLRLSEEDQRILETIHTFEGVISLEQVGRLVSPDTKPDQIKDHMKRLVDQGYVQTLPEGASDQAGEAEIVYWLDEKGAAAVATARGDDPAEFQWQRTLSWPLVSHNLTINRFHIDVVQACEASTAITLERWVPAQEFWAYPDTMSYAARAAKIGGPGSRPDGFFQLQRSLPDHTGEFAFILEIDSPTGNTSPLAPGEGLPGLAYLRSKSYQHRFGIRHCRWLAVAKEPGRMEHIRERARRADGQGLFYFTTLEQVTPQTVLSEPIWWTDNADAPIRLIPEAES